MIKSWPPLSVYYGFKDMQSGVNRFAENDKIGGALEFTKGLGSSSTGLVATTGATVKGLQLVNTSFSFLASSSAVVSTVVSTTGKVLPMLGGATAVFDGALTTYDGYKFFLMMYL